ncbi:MAG: HAMP domain-containing histidine kinase [Proteobacteria bacterium]|nr:MAG: HAMP domain-containing histidine kinase [Pseudomonadota bacterium]
MFKTLRFRLTLWHAIVFGCVTLGIFAFAYMAVSNQLLKSLRDDLQDTALEFSGLYRIGDIKALQAEINRKNISHGNELFYVQLINAKNKTIIQSRPKAWTLDLPKPDTTISGIQWFEAAINQQGERATLIVIPTYDHGWIQVGLSRRANEAQLKHIWDNFGWALIIIILAGIMTGWWQVSRALADVERVRRIAIGIGEGDFNQRLTLEGHGQELVDLADTFNVMLDKIQQLLGKMRDVSDNIAHDLRTPVTRLRGMAEAALMSKTSNHCENQEVLAEIINECDRLTGMINTMLEIAQSDSGALRLERKPVDMAALLHEVCDLFSPVAEDAGIDLKLELNATHLVVMGDQSRLQRLMANLVDNAIKFSPEGSRIRLAACKEGESICLFVIDSGMGIPEEDMPHIFDRFYRSDRSRTTLGNGLGLSYVKSIVTAHGGDIQIQSQLGSSTSVRITLPASTKL